jgi:epoxyqueuosine reductase QueG
MTGIELVENIIHKFWATSPSNSLQLDPDEKAWDTPHFAVAAGDDPLFARIKEEIGPFHWTPAEAFALAYPEAMIPAAELRVISYLLPQTAATRDAQRSARQFPAERWACSRFYGEQFNVELRLHLEKSLNLAGVRAVAPERLPGFDYRQSQRFGIASNWSERHAAFVAGHGTFGLADALITRFGTAVRFGSVVAHIDLPVTERPYGDDHHAWCLWYAKGTCGACVQRCPAGAITTDRGHDKLACFKYIRNITTPYATEHYGTGATPCGLCQVKVPCECELPPGVLE